MRNPTVKEAKLSLRRQESSTRDSTRLEDGLGQQCQKERASYAKEKERSMDLCLSIYLSVCLSFGNVSGNSSDRKQRTLLCCCGFQNLLESETPKFTNHDFCFILFYFILFYFSVLGKNVFCKKIWGEGDLFGFWPMEKRQIWWGKKGNIQFNLISENYGLIIIIIIIRVSLLFLLLLLFLGTTTIGILVP